MTQRPKQSAPTLPTVVEVQASLQKMERLFSYSLLAITLILLASQLRGVFYFPVVDSYLWWGDESWLLSEWKHQIATGLFANPFALGASIHAGNGALFNMSWISALLYGLPQLLLPTVDAVMVGRCVSALAAAALIASTYYTLRKLTGEELLSAFGLLLLVSSRSFLFTSHSARYDVLSALVLLLLFVFVSSRTRIAPVWYGTILPTLMLVSVHTLVLGAPLWVAGIYYKRMWKSRSELAMILVGVLAGSGLMYLSGWIGSGSTALFAGSSHTGFGRNMSELPIAKPFSRSVQLSTIVRRWQLVTMLAPLVMAEVVVAIMLWMTARLRQGAPKRTRLGSLTVCAIAMLLAWIEFEASGPSSYLIYLLPIAIVAATHSIARAVQSVRAGAGLKIASMILLFMLSSAIAALSFGGISEGESVAATLVANNDTAVDLALTAIARDAAMQHIASSRVLVQTPAVAEAMSWSAMHPSTPVAIMTTQFIEYPATDDSAPRVLATNGVSYMIEYRSVLMPYFMREVDVIHPLAEQHGTAIARTVQPLTDIGRAYSVPKTHALESDTLTVYRLHW